MPELAFAENLGLPERSAGAQTYGFIARKGGGKSYGAGKLAELLFGIGVPIIIIDPVGVWWGLRLAADASGPGLNIPVIGGLHGDLDLDIDAAERLASYLVSSGSSAVLDVSQLRKGQRSQFVAVFLESLFAAVKRERVRRQRMLIIEEAQAFAPQHSQGVTARTLGAVDDVVRLGRNFGLGAVLITQRPQSVSKEVLNQVECLMVGQLQGKHERDAIKGWIGEKGGELAPNNSAYRVALDGLPYLQPGDFHCWSPQWLKTFSKIRPLPKRTFDASATPELDEVQPVMPALDADFSALRAVLAKPSAELAEGPRPSDAKPGDAVAKLRAEVASLAEELMRVQADQANLALGIRERDRLIEELRRGGLGLISRLREIVDSPEFSLFDAESYQPLPVAPEILSRGRAVLADGREIDISDPANGNDLIPMIAVPVKPEPSKARTQIRKVPGTITHTVSRTEPGIMADAPLGKCARAILGALMDQGEMTRRRAGVLTGYVFGGGGFRNALTELRGPGFITERDNLLATGPIGPAGEFITPARGQALVAVWTAQLGLCARTILLALVGLQKGHRDLRAWSRQAVAARTALLTADGQAYAHAGGGFRNALTELRHPGLIQDNPDGTIALHHEVWRDLMA